MPRTEYCKSLRHSISEEVTFEGDLRMNWGLIRKGLGRGIPGEVTIGGTAGVKVLRKEGVELRGCFLEKLKISNHQAIFIYCYYSVTNIMLGTEI